MKNDAIPEAVAPTHAAGYQKLPETAPEAPTLKKLQFYKLNCEPNKGTQLIPRSCASVTMSGLSASVSRLNLKLLAPSPKSSVSVALAPYKTFPVQQAAFEYLDMQREPLISELRVFAEETSADGRRKFIITTPAKMWAVYQQLKVSERHFYEIIREGRPCHLYFDLEYDPRLNPGLDGNSMVEALIEVVKVLMKEQFSIIMSSDCVIELDSSTDKKFSRHLLVRIKRCAFQNNAHVGAFVDMVVEDVMRRGESDSRFAAFIVKKAARKCQVEVSDPTHDQGCKQIQSGDNEGPVCEEASTADPNCGVDDLFIDKAVYTRNRAFRMYLSSKVGKTAVLKLTKRFAGRCISQGLECAGKASELSQGSGGLMLTEESELQVSEIVFFSALICHVDSDCRFLKLPGVGIPQNCNNTSGLPPGPITKFIGMKRPYHVSNATDTANENAAPNHVLPSIFPKLDSFIEAACTQGGLQGLIRCWAIQGDTVMYSMKNNRWCGNIGGAHKSNGIYYVVDLRKGIWHQRCYDPHCRLYKSSAMPLPHEVWSAYKLES